MSIVSGFIKNMLSDVTPTAETVTPTSGTGELASRWDHRHPRLSSTTYHTLAANGEATVTFTRLFDAPPGMSLTYVELADNPPIVFKVKSWTQDGNGKYTGCVIKAYRGQVLPSTLVALTALLNYNVFGGSTGGVMVTCIALQQSTQV